MKITIQDGFSAEIDKQVSSWLKSYDLPKLVSKKLGLPLKKPVFLKHTEGNANWEGDNIILADFRRGIWCLPGIAHELVHIILRQNDWLSIVPNVYSFIQKHSEFSTPRGAGYLIEQMIAYLVQADISHEIGEKEKNAELINSWGPEKFDVILEKEYTTIFAKEIGQKIIDAWNHKEQGGLTITLIGNIVN